MRKYVLCMLFLLLLTSCQSASRQAERPTPEPTPTSFTLNGTDITFFNPGEHFDLKVRLVPEDAEVEVTWTSSDPDIASVSWNGRVTAISGGTVTITATIEGVGEQECVVRCQFADSANPAATVTPTPEPTPEPTAVGIEVDIGDGEHKFWVELVDTDTYGNLMVNIYEKPTDREPVQSFEDQCECSFERIYFYVEDVNFDGDTDFGVLYSRAPNGHASFSYYIWDAKEEKFIPDPYGLNELCSVGEPEMLPEEKAIRTFMRSNAGRSGEVRFYRYFPEGFTCVRKMDWEWHEDTDYTDFLVESYENGEMRIVYQDSLTPEALDGYLWSDEFSNWWDLSYSGE